MDDSLPGQNIYWLSARLTSWHALLALSLVYTVDYNIMHRHFAHSSKDVLQHASGNTQNFLVICHSLLLILYVRVVLKER